MLHIADSSKFRGQYYSIAASRSWWIEWILSCFCWPSKSQPIEWIILTPKIGSLDLPMYIKYINAFTWQFFVPFLRWLSDLQTGAKQVTLHHLVLKLQWKFEISCFFRVMHFSFSLEGKPSPSILPMYECYISQNCTCSWSLWKFNKILPTEVFPSGWLNLGQMFANIYCNAM